MINIKYSSIFIANDASIFYYNKVSTAETGFHLLAVERDEYSSSYVVINR